MKKILFAIVFSLLIVYACFFPQDALEASKDGITTWFEQILPSLLPFSILSAILIRSKCLHSLKAGGNTIASVFTLLCGFIFGFPIGAKLSSDFYDSHLLTRRQASILCILANNFSCMYVFGYVIPNVINNNHYNNATYCILYAVPLVLAVLLFIIVFRLNPPVNDKKRASRFQLDMQIIDAGIISGFEALIKICGYIVLFSIFFKMCTQFIHSVSITELLIIGNLEITNGILLLSQQTLPLSVRYILAIQLLSFGGISGLAQTASIIKPAGLSVKVYLLGKLGLSLFLTLCASLYVWLF